MPFSICVVRQKVRSTRGRTLHKLPATTTNDFRLYSAHFGIACAEAAKRKKAAGERRERVRAHGGGGMIPVKDTQVRRDRRRDWLFHASGLGRFLPAGPPMLKSVSPNRRVT
jgi:hypothetical protein